jgi:four helix bundle protein
MRDFTTLEVWQVAHRLTLDVYQVTRSFPKEESFGLTSQMRRACASIPANIAEGCGRQGDGELARFLHISMGSASELEYYFMLAHDLELLNAGQFEPLNRQLLQVKRMLNAFIQKLKADNRNRRSR